MGNTLGCCSKHEEDPNNVNMVFLEANYNNKEKMRRIVKIQAIFRGYLTRKRVRLILEQEGINIGSKFRFGGAANYENPDVLVRNISFALCFYRKLELSQEITIMEQNKECMGQEKLESLLLQRTGPDTKENGIN